MPRKCFQIKLFPPACRRLIQGVCFQTLHAVSANVHQSDRTKIGIYRIKPPVTTQWASSCGTAMRISAFVTDALSFAWIQIPAVCNGIPYMATFTEMSFLGYTNIPMVASWFIWIVRWYMVARLFTGTYDIRGSFPLIMALGVPHFPRTWF